MNNVIDKNIVKSAIIKRQKDAHKYSVGSLLSFCGSYGMTGAAIMSGKSALRSGIGFLRMLVTEEIYSIMAQAIPEAVFTFIKENDFSFLENINKNNCVLAGCGISTSDFSKSVLCQIIDCCKVPMVLDADALNIISKDISILKKAKAPIIVTPHNMEMARLTGLDICDIFKNREEVALNFSKEYGVITVLKGDKTIVTSPNGDVMINLLTGNPGMATAGSGDVLAGIIASLIAQGSDLYKGACAGVYIHGFAGDIAKEKYGEISMLPTDIINVLPQAFMSLS